MGPTVFDNHLVKHGDDELLEGSGGGVVDNGILARLQDETDVQGGNQQLALDVDGIVGEEGGECLEDLELDIQACRGALLESLEDLAQLGAREGAGDDEALQADDGDAGELCIFGAAGDDEGVDKVGVLGEFWGSNGSTSRQEVTRELSEDWAEGRPYRNQSEPLWVSSGS